MANYSKAFNFRGGFQVDTDVLVVRGEKVGIGSTEPAEVLDVNGIIRAKGLEVDSTEGVNFQEGSIGILTVRDELYIGVSTFDNHGTIIAIGTGIITATSDSVGLVTYYGDGRFLQGLPTSQWLDVDIGLGYTSIYAQGNVGVDTIDPRYKFQVGGVPFVIPAGVGTVPFRFNQEGVGIQSGCVYVSDDLRVGGGISVTGTIGIGETVNVDGNIGVGSNLTVVGFVSAYEFIGIGSQISMINADNIAIGSIGSMRYGDIINTKEVYADRFIGTATMAEDLVPEAQIDIDVARADEVDAITRFISTEGKLQIGSDAPVTVTSDIDLFRTGGVTISGISTASTSRIFVGKERPIAGNRSFGGLRYGGDPIDAPSGAIDLDLVNYDAGNVNTYLHSGSGGTTTGEFRWIYGQTDRILASLNKEGRLSLFGNTVTGNVNLSVVGISTFEEVRAEDIAVGVGSVAGDFAVYGTLFISGGVGVTTDLVFQGAEFSDDVVVGGDPLDGDIGVRIGADGVLTVSSGISLTFGGSQEFAVDAAGNVTSTGDITADGTISGLVVNGGTITALTSLEGPSFTNSGQLTAVDDLQATGTGSFSGITAATADINILSIGAQITFDNGSTVIGGSSIVVDELTVNNNINGDFIVNGDIELNNVIANNVDVANLTANSGIITTLQAETLTVSQISSGGGTLTINSNVDITNGVTTVTDLTVDGTLEVSSKATFDNVEVNNVGSALTTTTILVENELQTADVRVNGDLEVDGTIDVSGSDRLDFSFGRMSFTINGSGDLEITIQETGGGTISGTISMS
jgi:hypothetical protein